MGQYWGETRSWISPGKKLFRASRMAYSQLSHARSAVQISQALEKVAGARKNLLGIDAGDTLMNRLSVVWTTFTLRSRRRLPWASTHAKTAGIVSRGAQSAKWLP